MMRWIGLAIIAVLPAVIQAQQTPRHLFERARLSEESGQLHEAIKLYEQAVAQSKGDRELAARAQFQIGVAYEKLNSPEAPKAYRLVTEQYADQAVAVDARQRMVRLGGGSTSRRVCSDCVGSLFDGGNRVSFNEDGRFIASTEEMLGVAIRDMTTGQVTRVTGAIPLRVALSPDGRQLAYETAGVMTQAGVTTPNSTAGGAGLMVADNQAEAKPRLLVNNPEFRYIHPAAWAPDNKSVLVTIQRHDRTWEIAWVSVADGKVTTLKSVGWRLDPIARPSLSRDGRFIAYSALVDDLSAMPDKQEAITDAFWGPNAKDQHIYVLDAERYTEVEVVKGASVNQSPVWIPDGSGLLFLSNRTGGNFGLWSVPLNAGVPGTPIQVKPGTGRITPVDEGLGILPLGITRSGSLYYVQTQEGGSQIVVSDISGKAGTGSEGARTSFAGASPSWSPDGKFIAFVRESSSGPRPQPQLGSLLGLGRLALRSGLGKLMVYSTDTGDETRYAPEMTAVSTSKALWFRDGKALLQMMRDSDGKNSLYRIDLKTGEARQLVPPVTVMPVAISTDNQTIYVRERGNPATNGNSQTDLIVAIDLGNGQRSVSSVSASQSNLSPDSKTLYKAGCDASRPPVPQVPAAVADLIAGAFNRGCRRILAVDTATGQERTIWTASDSESVINFALSPDGQKLAALLDNSDGKTARGTSTLIRIGVDGNGYRKLQEWKPPVPASRVYWTVDGTALIAPIGLMSATGDGVLIQIGGAASAKTAPTQVQVLRIPDNGGQSATILSIPADYWESVELSPDAARGATSVIVGKHAEIWAIDNVTSFVNSSR
jgi:Tol biopolymer transport system component